MLSRRGVIFYVVVLGLFARFSTTQNLIEGIRSDDQKVNEANNDIGERLSVQDLLQAGDKRNGKLDQIISILESLQQQVNTLQNTVQRLKTEKTKSANIEKATEKCQCKGMIK